MIGDKSICRIVSYMRETRTFIVEEIISNNQGNTGGDSNTHTLDNLGWIYSLNPTVDGEGNISVDVITFVIQPNSGFTSYSVKVIFDPREGIVYYNKLNDSINIIPSDSSKSQIDNSLT